MSTLIYSIGHGRCRQREQRTHQANGDRPPRRDP